MKNQAFSSRSVHARWGLILASSDCGKKSAVQYAFYLSVQLPTLWWARLWLFCGAHVSRWPFPMVVLNSFDTCRWPGKWPKIQAGWSPMGRPFLVFAGAALCDLRTVRVTRTISRVLQWIVWSYMAPHGDLLL